jgi:tRNA(Ile)-lysidine synthase
MAPWLRDRLPLLWVDGELAAVANLWVAAPFACPSGVTGLRLHRHHDRPVGAAPA